MIKYEFNIYTDEELLDAYDGSRGNMSYYNAAEGQMWYKETEQRNAERTKLNKIKEEMDKRGLKGRSGNFLC